MRPEISRLAFEQVAQVWREHLWPGRIDIEPYSAIKYGTHPYQYNVDYKHEPATFLGAFIGGQLVGVNSGHGTGQSYRSRGLFVLPAYRGQGIAQLLLRATVAQALAEDRCFAWSMPRRAALATYLAAGFRQDSDWFGTETNDANCYVVLAPHAATLTPN